MAQRKKYYSHRRLRQGETPTLLQAVTGTFGRSASWIIQKTGVQAPIIELLDEFDGDAATFDHGPAIDSLIELTSKTIAELMALRVELTRAKRVNHERRQLVSRRLGNPS